MCSLCGTQRPVRCCLRRAADHTVAIRAVVSGAAPRCLASGHAQRTRAGVVPLLDACAAGSEPIMPDWALTMSALRLPGHGATAAGACGTGSQLHFYCAKLRGAAERGHGLDVTDAERVRVRRMRRTTPSSRTSRRVRCASTPTTSTGTTASCLRRGRTRATPTRRAAACLATTTPSMLLRSRRQRSRWAASTPSSAWVSTR